MSQTTDPPDPTDEAPKTGWTVIAESPSLVAITDRLLSMGPTREFNKTELADYADVSRGSVHTHLDTLLTLGVVERVPETSPQRYRFNAESDVSEALIRLDGAVNNAGPHAE